jgi:uncharacterized protein (TIGR03086 family)
VSDLPGEVGLLKQAIGYGLLSVEAVSSAILSRRTPCAGWDLRMLLLHLNDSLGALQEGIDAGCVDLVPAEPDPPAGSGGDPAADLVAMFHLRTRRLLASWGDGADQPIGVGGHSVEARVVAVVGAIEIAVHGWDISVACGRSRPIPAALAAEMMQLSPLVIDESIRRPLFAAPVLVSPLASPSDRLIAYFGRDPEV